MRHKNVRALTPAATMGASSIAGRRTYIAGMTVATGMAIGMTIGVAIGAMMDNPAIGIALGAAVGAAVAAARNRRDDDGPPA
jgi:uncharacterized membrane protein